jgi:hypothetical protein
VIDHRTIKELIPILKTHGVKTFKAAGFEVEFHMEQKGEICKPNPRWGSGTEDPAGLRSHKEHQDDHSIQNLVDTIKKQEEALPVDLRADALMDQDKILNWSSPDQKPFEQDQELPLTGEMPL